MEDSDFLGQMMQTDEAASVRFVMECFLLLDPEDLKACRLVSKQWDEFIKREVWNNQYGKKRLTQKLVLRWMSEKPKEKVLFRRCINPEKWASTVCDEQHVFCGEVTGKVRMYRLSDGVMERELNPGPADERLEFNWTMAIKNGLLASAGCLDRVPCVTVWDTKTSNRGEVIYKRGSRGENVTALEVVNDRKIAIVQQCYDTRETSLVLIEKVEDVWIAKDLAQCVVTFMHIASEKDWLVSLEKNTLTVYTSSDKGKEHKMPASGEKYIRQDMSMSLPLLVTFNVSFRDRKIGMQVFKFKGTGTDPFLLKNIYIDTSGGFVSVRPIFSKCAIGMLYCRERVGPVLHVFEKAKLVDASVLPENVERREVDLGTEWFATHGYGTHSGVCINRTSLVYIKGVEQGGQLHHQSLVKRDFWMSNIKSK